MSRPNKITIAVITFHNDFQLLKNLLTSIYKNWSPDEIDSIKIVLNDSAVYYDQFNEIIDEMTVPNFRLDRIFSYELEPTPIVFDWHSQQLFKCVVSKKIATDWYLIHDCKDQYVSPVSIADCFTEQGRALMHLSHARHSNDPHFNTPITHWGFGPFSLSFETSCRIWGIDPADHKGYHLPFLTPFFVKTNMMKNMVDELKNMLKGIFPFLFSIHLDGAAFVTEFLLYNAYCCSKNKLDDYADWRHNDQKFFSAVIQSLENRNSDGSRKMNFRAT